MEKSSNTKILAGWALALGGIGAYAYSPEVREVAGFAAGWAAEILNQGGGFINTSVANLGANVPVVGGLAPFAAPTIAGAYLWKKVSDIVGWENGYMKAAATFTWGAIGAAATASVAAPYLTWAAIATAVAKPVWNLGAGAIGYAKKWVGGLWWWVLGGAKWLVKWPLKWAAHGAKSGYHNPALNIKSGL